LRRIIVEVAPSGFDIEDKTNAIESWTQTSFGAAVDASAARVWPQSSAPSGKAAWAQKYGWEPYGVAKTQRRHIAGINSLFGISANRLEDQSKVVAAIGVDLTVLVQAAGHPRDGPKMVAEGSKGVAVLRALGRSRRRLLPGITRLGFEREFWGPQVR
jgi:hypothetical protein